VCVRVCESVCLKLLAVTSEGTMTTHVIHVGLAITIHTKIRRIWIRRITVTVYGNFRPYPYPYDRTWVLADRTYTSYVQSKPYISRIWTVIAGDKGSIPSNSSHVCSFCQIFS